MSEANAFTSDRRERLNKQGFSEKCEDVKLGLRPGEVRLTPREEKPCGFVDHFFALAGKKMVGIERFDKERSDEEPRRRRGTSRLGGEVKRDRAAQAASAAK